MHPVLLPGARKLWRDGSSLQLGRGARRSVVLGGLDPALRAMLDLLDGTRDREQVVVGACASGCPPARARQLLDLLDAAGLLADGAQDRSGLDGLAREERERLAPDLASLTLVRDNGAAPVVGLRRAVEILVVGAGRVGVPVALALAAAGIGTVDIVDDGTTRPQDTGVGGLGPADVGRPRGRAARELLRRTVPAVGGGPVTRPDLVVLAGAALEARERSRALALEGTPHLVAEVRETTGVVGPLVLPGRAPCLRCLDLTRSDLDPAWPVLAAQLADSGRGEPPCDGPLALAVAAQAASQVLSIVDGPPGPPGSDGAGGTDGVATVGGTLEMSLPDWRWRRRSWPLHPDCGCAPTPPPPATTGSAGPPDTGRTG